MSSNVGVADRVVRVILGAVLLIWAIGFPESPYSAFGWIGIIPLATGLLGTCLIYKILGMSTK